MINQCTIVYIVNSSGCLWIRSCRHSGIKYKKVQFRKAELFASMAKIIVIWKKFWTPLVHKLFFALFFPIFSSLCAAAAFIVNTMQQKLLNAVLACFWENDGQELAPINSSLAKPAFYVNKGAWFSLLYLILVYYEF